MQNRVRCQAPGSNVEAAPQMPIPQEVAESHPAARLPEASSQTGRTWTHSHTCTPRAMHDHSPEQPEPSTTTPPVPGALQAPQDIGYSGVKSHLCLFCDLDQLTLPVWASVLHMETELAIALFSMRVERGYVCENCARCPAGGMCQFFLFPSLLSASHFHLPCLSGQPQHYGCCLSVPRLKQPLYLLATRCHPSVPPSTLAAESTNHQSRDKLPHTQQCPWQPSVIDAQRRTAEPPSYHHNHSGQSTETQIPLGQLQLAQLPTHPATNPGNHSSTMDGALATCQAMFKSFSHIILSNIPMRKCLLCPWYR